MQPRAFSSLLLLLLLSSIPGAGVAKVVSKPNIILILADDLGWKDVGYAGSSFYRTFLAAAGLPLQPQQHVDGISLMPALVSSGKVAERPLVFHFPHYTHAAGPNSVLVEKDWKLIRFYNDETGRYLLYHLAEDPFEQHDLSAGMPGKVKKLDKQLTQILDDMKAQMPVKNPAYDPDSENLINRQFTLSLAIREHQMFAAQLREAGMIRPKESQPKK